jgi:hypothetical protein
MSNRDRFFVLDGNGGIFVGGDRTWAFDKGWTLDMLLWREKGGDWMDMILFRMVAGEDHRMHGRGEVVMEVLLREGQVSFSACAHINTHALKAATNMRVSRPCNSRQSHQICR